MQLYIIAWLAVNLPFMIGAVTIPGLSTNSVSSSISSVSSVSTVPPALLSIVDSVAGNLGASSITPVLSSAVQASTKPYQPGFPVTATTSLISIPTLGTSPFLNSVSLPPASLNPPASSLPGVVNPLAGSVPTPDPGGVTIVLPGPPNPGISPSLSWLRHESR